MGRAPDELDGRQVSRREGVRSPYTLQAGYPIRHPRSWGRSAWSRTCECAVCECVCEGRVLHAPTPQAPSPTPRGRTPSRHRTPSHLHKGHPSGREKPARDAFVARMVSWTFHPPHRVLFRFRTAYFGSLSVQGYPILNPKGKVRVHRPLSTCNRKQNLLTGHHPPRCSYLGRGAPSAAPKGLGWWKRHGCYDTQRHGIGTVIGLRNYALG